MKPYLSFVGRIIRSNVSPLDYPYKLNLAVTYKCNSRCLHCGIWKREPANELSINELDRFFSFNNRWSWIDLTGGEISLHPEFTEICRLVLAHCKNLLILHFPTNGLNPSKIEQLVREVAKLKPHRLIITVSLDGSEAVNDRVRGVRGGWKKQLETFRRLRGIPRVTSFLGMTLSSFNYRDLASTYSEVQKEVPWVKKKDFHFNLFHVSSHYYCNQDNGPRLFPPGEEPITSLREFMNKQHPNLSPMGILENCYFVQATKYLKEKQTPIPCRALDATCFIDPNGNVYPCTIYNRKIGNIREHDYRLTPILNSTTGKNASDDIQQGNCPQCWTPCEAYPAILANLSKAAYSVFSGI